MVTYFKPKILISVFFVFLLISINVIFAQTTGKIVGNVSEAKTNDPLIGANVIIEGTYMGAATDVSGDYYIINVPPGTYNVKIQMMGYQPYLVQKVVVSVNRSTTVNAKLSQAVLEGEEVIVTAEKISIKKDQTSSIKNVSADQIALLPVENVDQVIEMQAGIVGGHFRGGRLSEVSYLIDGIQVDEAFNSESSTIELEKEVVQDLEVITGTFNAEYGRAMSGIVNMVTKDGGNQFHGSAHANLGNYVTSNDHIFQGLKYGDFGRKQDYKFQLEGPILKDHLFFITNVRYVNDQGYLNGIRRFDVGNYSNYQDPDAIGLQISPWDIEVKDKRYYSEHTGGEEYIPMNNNSSLSIFGKLTMKPFQNLKTALLFSRNEREESVGINREGGGYNHYYKYNPDGVSRNHFESNLFTLNINHLLSKKLFYVLIFSANQSKFGRYLYEDPLDSRYVSDAYSQTRAGGFSSGGMDKNHLIQFTDQYSGKFDLTWQVNKNHSLKSGMQYIQYRVENRPSPIRDTEWEEPVIISDSYDPEKERMVFNRDQQEMYPDASIEMDTYVKKPIDFSWYMQDKMEFDKLVLNYGVRFDYFDPKTKYPTNRRNPANQGTYSDSSFYSDYLDADAKMQWSPRIGLSYTLGRAAVLHFSYGHFFQIPPFYALYNNYRFMIPLNNFGTEHGNPQINPQKTVKYEMGLWQELFPGLSFELSVYYSDVHDLLTAVVHTTYNEIQYALYSNKDYANTKGLEVILNWIYGNISTNFNYTLQYTRGNADNPKSTYNRLAQNQDPIPVLIPLSWDQRHTASINVAYSTPNFSVSSTYSYNSGFPYTISPVQDSRLARQNVLPNNSVRPANTRFDLQGHYDIPLSKGTKFRLFLYVKNLFDSLNEMEVYGSTGRAYTKILENVAEQTFISDYNTVYDQYQNPGMFSAPREIKLGIGYIF